jgi:iron complex transport system ATP-binding protein
VLTVVHDLALAARFAGRVIVMERGRLVADASPGEALTADRLAQTFGVEAALVDIGDGAMPIARRPL